MNLEDHIRRYLAQNVLYVDDGFDYRNDTSFLAEGIIDSMGVMEIVAYVQSAFQINVEQSEVTPENFDSITGLAAFIRRKQAAAVPAPGPGENHAGAEWVGEQRPVPSR